MADCFRGNCTGRSFRSIGLARIVQVIGLARVFKRTDLLWLPSDRTGYGFQGIKLFERSDWLGISSNQIGCDYQVIRLAEVWQRLSGDQTFLGDQSKIVVCES